MKWNFIWMYTRDEIKDLKINLRIDSVFCDLAPTCTVTTLKNKWYLANDS